MTDCICIWDGDVLVGTVGGANCPHWTRDPRDAELAALRAENEALRVEREAFIQAANDTAGTDGWAWTAAMSKVSGEIARLRLPAEVVATIRDALTDDMRRFNEADGVALAALDAAYPEKS